MTPEEFFEEIKRGARQRYAFVLGNGINYHLKNSAVSWNDLLEEFLERKPSVKIDFTRDKGVTSPEAANLLELMIDIDAGGKSRAAAVRKELMRFLKERLDSDAPKRCALLDAAWEKHHILTTNFDENIEKYIGKSNDMELVSHKTPASPAAKGKRGGNSYLWNSFWGAANCPEVSDSGDLHNDIWHIHGKLDDRSSPTVLFSLTRYVNAIKQVEQWGLASEPNWPGRNTWVNIFYNLPLIVAGLGLTDQEVFLRTLLIERKRHWRKSEGKKEPQSYYLVRKDDKPESDGRLFLRALGFKVVEFDNSEDLYNNKNW